MTTEQMLSSIRKIIGQCTATEKETYEALLSESAGWEMRLEEIEAADSDEVDEGTGGDDPNPPAKRKGGRKR